jgi:hypothetical protein
MELTIELLEEYLMEIFVKEKIMKRYIGVKEITAAPHTKDGVEGYKVVYKDGYTSWSPKAVFEEVYRETTGLTFGLAIEAAKLGKKVARLGWNGSNMYAVLMPGYSKSPLPARTCKIMGLPEGTEMAVRPYWALKTAQEDIATWTPSGSDTLAEDWIIVE